MGRRGRDQAGRAGEWKNLKMEVTFWKRHRFRSKVAAPTQARDHVERKPISLVNKRPGKKAKVSQKKISPTAGGHKQYICPKYKGKTSRTTES